MTSKTRKNKVIIYIIANHVYIFGNHVYISFIEHPHSGASGCGSVIWVCIPPPIQAFLLTKKAPFTPSWQGPREALPAAQLPQAVRCEAARLRWLTTALDRPWRAGQASRIQASRTGEQDRRAQDKRTGAASAEVRRDAELKRRRAVKRRRAEETLSQCAEETPML